MINVDRRNAVTGLLFFVCGCWFVFQSRALRFGSLSEMGPGFLPVVAGGTLAFVGVVLGVKAILSQDLSPIKFGLRPFLIVIASVVGFAVMLNSVGAAMTTWTIAFAASFADSSISIRQRLLLATVIAAFSSILFVTVLGLPAPMWPQW